jgi:hypothetical protein
VYDHENAAGCKGKWTQQNPAGVMKKRYIEQKNDEVQTTQGQRQEKQKGGRKMKEISLKRKRHLPWAMQKYIWGGVHVQQQQTTATATATN